MANSPLELDYNKSEEIDLFDESAGLIVHAHQIFEKTNLIAFVKGKSPSIRIPENPSVVERLKTYYQEAMVQVKKTGRNPLRLGFPVVYIKEKTGYKPMPIYTVPVSIENGLSGQLTLHLDFYQGVKFNKHLVNYFPRVKERIDLLQGKFKFDYPSLDSIGQDFSDLFSIPYRNSNDNPSLPVNSDLEFEEDSGIIHNLIQITLLGDEEDLPRLLSINEFEPVDKALSIAPLTPLQASAFAGMQEQKRVAIQGIRGGGKTKLITNYSAAALANGQKSLILANYLSPLKEIQERLFQLGLGSACFLLRSQLSDQKLLIDYLRTAQNLRPEKSNNQTGYSTLRERLLWKKTKLDQQYLATKKQLLGALNWTELVGRYLINNRLEGRETLATYLNPLLFEYTGKEWEYLYDAVKTATSLNLNRRTNSTLLTQLHADLFLEMDLEESKTCLDTKLAAIIELLERLRRDYSMNLGQYSELLFKHYNQHRSTILQKLNQLKDALTDAEITYGNLINRSNQQIRIRASFSSKYRALRQEKQKIIAQYEAFIRFFGRTKLFEYKFPGTDQLIPFNNLENILGNFETAFNLWRKDITGLIQDDMGRLSIKTAVPELEFLQPLEQLELDLEQTLTEINEAKVLNQNLSNKLLVIPQQQKFVEDLLQQIKQIANGLEEFEGYYTWNRFWLQLNDSAKKIIEALQKVNPNDWLAAFESWYWHNSLIKFDHNALPVSSPELDEFESLASDFKNLQLRRVKSQSKAIRIQAIQALKRKSRSAFSNLYQKPIEKLPTYQKLIKNYLSEILEGVPILISSPNAIANLIDRNIQYQGFDQVLIEDAHMLSPRSLDKVFSWSTHVILFYDEQLASPKWLNWLDDQDFSRYSIGYPSRLTPANLPVINAFDPGDKHSHFQACEVSFYQIDGRYEEPKRVNEEEAQFVLRQLNEIPENPNKRTFPKVGIICLSKAQRDLIQQYIHQIKFGNLPGTERIERLLRNGLDILSVEDLAAEENYEIVILSCTMGIMNLQGEITNHFQQFNLESFKRGILELMAIPRRRLVVVSSIPEAFLHHWLTNKDQILFNWSAYLLSLKAIAEQNNLKLAQISKHWKEVHPPDRYQELSSKLFLSEVAQDLKKELKDQFNILEDLIVENQLFHFALESKEQPGKICCLVADGFLSDGPHTDYIWEINQLRSLKEKGFYSIPVFSLNWWRDQKSEKQRVINEIHQLINT